MKSSYFLRIFTQKDDLSYVLNSGYTKLNSWPVESPSYQDINVVVGTTYYYVITAVNTSNQESGYSNEASATPEELKILVAITYPDMVLEMSNSSQFIVITHNKTSMEFADVLYGITMQEPGVSKLVSVRLREEAKAA